MATFERCAGDHVAERVRPEPGSDDETRYEQLAASGSGWRRVEEGAGKREPAPSSPKARTKKTTT